MIVVSESAQSPRLSLAVKHFGQNIDFHVRDLKVGKEVNVDLELIA